MRDISQNPCSNHFSNCPVQKDRSVGIDLLRAIFALWVIMAHLIPWAIRAQGDGAVPSQLVFVANFLGTIFQPVGELHPAVLGFIVLSGYCIHRNGLRSNSFDLSKYAIRRIFRIIPVYLAAICGGVVLYYYAAHKDLGLVKELSSTVQINIEYLAVRLSGFAAIVPWFYYTALQGNGPLNTVMVEIWLYALYPFFFYFFLRIKSLKTIFLLIIFYFFVSETIIFLFMSGKPITPLYSWFQNASVFSFVIYWWIGALFVSPEFSKNAKKCFILCLVVWGLLTLFLVKGIFDNVGPVLAEARKLMFALMIGQFINYIDSLKLKRVGFLGLIGQSGYSLYAFHAPITYTLCIYGASWWVILLTNIVCGLLIYRFYEKPLSKLGYTLLPYIKTKTVLN